MASLPVKMSLAVRLVDADLDAARKIIEGTAKNMGLEIIRG